MCGGRWLQGCVVTFHLFFAVGEIGCGMFVFCAHVRGGIPLVPTGTSDHYGSLRFPDLNLTMYADLSALYGDRSG